MLKVNKSEYLVHIKAKFWVFDAAALFLSLIGVLSFFAVILSLSKEATKDKTDSRATITEGILHNHFQILF